MPTRSCPTSGPTAASPRSSSRGRPSRASTCARPARTSSEGDLLIEEGTLLGPRQLGLLASVGRASVVVRPRPRVVILSTGSELREPGTAPRPRLDLRRQLLHARGRRHAARARSPTGSASSPTSPPRFLDALGDQLVRADLVVTSGGVSQGDYDVVKEALRPLGTVWFGGVAMQPGKPQGFGVVGEDETPIFTLPGNPVSSYVSFEMFVLPALRRMMGQPPYAARPSRPRSPTPSRRRRAARSSCAASSTSTATGPCVSPVGWRRLAPGRRPRRRQRADRRAERRPPSLEAGAIGRGAAAGPGVLMADATHRLTHVDESGAARMVDVSGKDVDRPGRDGLGSGAGLAAGRRAAARRGRAQGRHAGRGPARRDHGAPSRRPTLIPLCHPLMLSSVTVDLAVADDSVDIVATVRPPTAPASRWRR